MGLSNYYYYDEEECKFAPIRYNTFERVVYTASLWIMCGVVLAGAGIAALSSFAGTPSEIALRAENQVLVDQLKVTKNKIQDLDSQVKQLAMKDNEVYRTMLGMDPISYDERQAGSGGADIYADFDVFNEGTADILKWTASNLENLQRRISIQKVSFNELKSYYNKNQKKLSHMPAIRPVPGIMLSGFGMRYHPVLKYRRMHDGLDFRAKVGTPIHATGDGVIKYAARKGTYGLLIMIDHGYGIETRFAHLSAFKKGIRPGVKVKRGDVIGYTGNTGLTEGPHLHYEIRRKGEPIDPLNYLFANITPEEYAMYQEIAKKNPNSMD